LNKLFQFFALKAKTQGAKNSVWLTIEKIVELITSFLVLVALARSLSLTAYGVLSYALAVFALVYPFAVFGLNAYITKEVIRSKSTLEVVTAGFAIRFVASIIAVSLVYTFLKLFIPDGIDVHAISILLIAILFSPFYVYENVLHAFSQMKLIAMIRIFSVVFFGVLKLVVVAQTNDVLYLVIVFSVEHIVDFPCKSKTLNYSGLVST
jgi:O-antigen/teichoic acid export membrane protein